MAGPYSSFKSDPSNRVSQKDLIDLLQKNSEIAQQANYAQAGAKQKAQSDSRELAQKGQQEEDQAKLKNMLESKQQAGNLQAAQDYVEQNAKAGRKVNIGLTGTGGVSVSQNETNPAIAQQRIGMQQSKAEQQAYQAAANTYQKGIAGNATTVQSLHTMLGALNSNDPSSMGQIRTAMVLSNGFKRYNDNEGVALTPDDKQADMASFLGKFGIGLKDRSLSDVTRSNVIRYANNKLDELQDAHNTLKAQAQGMYSNSQFADPVKAQSLGDTLGSPVDKQLVQLKNQFDQFHSKAISSTPARGDGGPSRGFMDQLRGLVTRQPTPTSMPQAAPQQAPPGSSGMGDKGGGFDPSSY